MPGQGDNSGIRTITTFGEVQSANSNQAGQLFPRTNHITWQDYTVCTMKRVEGQYHLVKETFRAPTLPKASILQR